MSASQTAWIKYGYLLRQLALGLVLLSVAVPFWYQGASLWVWTALLCYCLGWPHLARLRTFHSAQPLQAEHQHLQADGVAIGFWLAAMGFMVVPGATLMMVLMGTALLLSGGRLLLMTLLALVLGAMLGALFAFPGPHLAASLPEQLASVPLLLAFPLVVALAHGLELPGPEPAKAALEPGGFCSKAQWLQQLDKTVASGGDQPACLMVLDLALLQGSQLHSHSARKKLARLLKMHIRPRDAMTLLGPDELAILLPETGPQAARIIADRLRLELEQASPLKYGTAPLCLGMASLRPELTTGQEWLVQAQGQLALARKHQQFSTSPQNRPASKS